MGIEPPAQSTGPRRLPRLRLLLLATAGTMALMWIIGRPLAIVPHGIVQLELAGSANAAARILSVWTEHGLIARARASVELDYLFLIAYGAFLTALVRRMRWTNTILDGVVAYAQIAAAGCDAIENVGLLVMLSGGSLAPTAAMTQGFAMTKFLFIAAGLVYLAAGGIVTWVRRWPPAWITRIDRAAMTFSDLRPSFVFGALMVYLPLTAVDHVPGWALFGNLFVGYTAGQAAWFGMALCAAIVTLMITSALGRDIQTQLRRERRAVFPISLRAALGYTPVAAPALIVVTVFAPSPLAALVGQLIGASITIGGLTGLTWLLFPADRLLAWQPRASADGTWLSRSWQGLVRMLGHGLRVVWLSDDYFDGDELKAPHVFGFTLLTVVTAIYIAIYFLLKYSRQTSVTAHALPSAVYLFALFIPMMWLVSFFWLPLRRYRLMLMVLVGYLAAMYAVGGGPLLIFGGPAHTYDVFDIQPETGTLTASDALTAPPFQARRPRTLVVVAASGGGIVASAWTAKVLGELAAAYPGFGADARLLSTVSGGSVAAAHYMSMLEKPVTVSRLREFLTASMTSSLAATAYGLAFADLRRALFPVWVTEWFDRGRLLEADWRALGNRLRAGSPLDAYAATDKSLVLVSDWRPKIRTGELPAVIFNTTVMESGERIAITPISDLTTPWPLPPELAVGDGHRFHYPRVLSQFLGVEDTVSVDVWTAARLSATFAYISPAARASHAYRRTEDPNEVGRRCRWDEPGNVDGCWAADEKMRIAPAPGERPGLQHLIDGGYHDNYGVGSALNWLNLVLGECEQSLFDRVALVEIRARPASVSAAPASEMLAAWLGPPLGLASSWSLAQRSANDTAVAQMIDRFQDRCGQEIRPFVFELASDGPLSWQLSAPQKADIYAGWGRVVPVRESFLEYLGAVSADNRRTELLPLER